MHRIHPEGWFYIVVMYKTVNYAIVVKNKTIAEVADYLLGRFGILPALIVCEEIGNGFDPDSVPEDFVEFLESSVGRDGGYLEVFE